MWSQRGLSRRVSAIGRLLRRQKATARQIATGAAIGILFAFIAPPGIQLIPALLIASLMGASRVSAALGAFVSNPLTMPVIYPLAYRIGGWVTGVLMPVKVPDETEEIWEAALSHATPPHLLINMFVGLVLMGCVLALIAFHFLDWYLAKKLRRNPPPESAA